MKPWTLLVAAAVLGMAALPATAQPAPASPGSGAALLRISGNDAVFIQFSAGIVAEPWPPNHGARFDAAWRATAADTFDAAHLNQRLAESLERQLTQADIDELTAFYASPFGRRIVALEQAPWPPGGPNEAIAEGARILAKSSAERRDQIEAMLSSLADDSVVANYREGLRGMSVGAFVASNAGRIPVPWGTIDAMVDMALAGYVAAIRPDTRAILAWTYRTLNDAEFASYAAFVQQPAARRFLIAQSASAAALLHDAMTAFGDALAARLASPPPA